MSAGSAEEAKQAAEAGAMKTAGGLGALLFACLLGLAKSVLAGKNWKTAAREIAVGIETMKGQGPTQVKDSTGALVSIDPTAAMEAAKAAVKERLEGAGMPSWLSTLVHGLIKTSVESK